MCHRSYLLSVVNNEAKPTFVIPGIWIREAENQAGRLNYHSSCSFIPVPVKSETEYSNLPGLIETSILSVKESGSVVVMLPHRFAKGSAVKFWPDIILNSNTGYVLTAVDFADDLQEFLVKSEAYLMPDNINSGIINASCQYEPPYTQTLNTWTDAGARSFHPGDFYKYEFLEALRTMKGHWFYWGHSDCTKLRAYHHIHTEDLLNAIPESPLQSTIWFSCSTLNIKHEQSIVLDWFLNGATRCIMAGKDQIMTIDNQLLSFAFLETLQKLKSPCFADIINHLLSADSNTYLPIIKSYRILGSPWISFGNDSKLLLSGPLDSKQDKLTAADNYI